MGLDDSAQLITGEAVSLDLRPTSFVLRAAGSLIDAIVYLGGYIAVELAILFAAPDFFADSALSNIVSIALLVLALIVAPTAVETLSHGRSLGRLAVGARIVREDGGAIGFRHAFIRALVGLLDFFMSLGGVAVVVGLLDERSRRLGDLIAGTYSQHERVARVDPVVFGVPGALEVWARTADVARLPDALGRRIAQFLAHATSLTPASRIALARRLEAEVSTFVSPMPGGDPELLLAAVVVLRREREAAALAGDAARLHPLETALTALPHGFPDRG